MFVGRNRGVYIVEGSFLLLVYDGLVVPVMEEQNVGFPSIVEGRVVGGCVPFCVLEKDVGVVV